MVLNKGLKDPAQSSITGKICNGMGTKKTAYGKALHTLFSAELKPRGYYLEHIFKLDHVILTNLRHVYLLDQ